MAGLDASQAGTLDGLLQEQLDGGRAGPLIQVWPPGRAAVPFHPHHQHTHLEEVLQVLLVVGVAHQLVRKAPVSRREVREEGNEWEVVELDSGQGVVSLGGKGHTVHRLVRQLKGARELPRSVVGAEDRNRVDVAIDVEHSEAPATDELPLHVGYLPGLLPTLNSRPLVLVLVLVLLVLGLMLGRVLVLVLGLVLLLLLLLLLLLPPPPLPPPLPFVLLPKKGQ